MIEIRNLIKKFDGVTVLNIDKLDIETGKLYAIVGENGSGKSTLLKLLARVEDLDEGTILINKELKVGYLPQKTYPFNMNVFNNIIFTQEKKDKELALKTLEEYELTHLKNKSAKKLSGGETQRLCFARLLQNRYDILLLDEFTSSTDREKQSFLNQKVKEYQQKHNNLVVFASHTSSQIDFLANVKIYFKDGKIINID